ncbi:hypothetical protein [Chitinilyticum piscinae]|uniref:Solute-binding protein family 3/N-terminal domain-containing protein n=1 Tax=Chitinilyticum piscinae TaxID=2866724 RepID=A0A8J7FNV4_9NEIS|nr:hypothetical protein [Chitinilyticum piscinae]MBE9609509.1 hypothetical protein [Chitinilyticum piscinae]
MRSYVLILLLLLSPLALCEDITLRLQARRDGQHEYYHRLLSEALRAQGHTVTLQVSPELPAARRNQLLESGEISVHWLLQSKQRDAQYLPVPVGLTKGLIGQRLLLIPRGASTRLAGVNNLADLQALNLRAGMGKDWFDVRIWQFNRLPVFEQTGDWQLLYRMLLTPERQIDYLPRGALEIGPEQQSRPELEIEPRLVLVYDRDFIFYVSPREPGLHDAISQALTAAAESGLQQRLLEQHFRKQLQPLNLQQRVRIPLVVPDEL